MALNIKELIALADRLDEEGRHKEAGELDKMIQKLAVEWKDLSPEEQKELTERQDWHQDPVGYINRPEQSEEDERLKEMTDPEKLKAAQEHFDEFLAKLEADGVSAKEFFKLLQTTGGMILDKNPETGRFEAEEAEKRISESEEREPKLAGVGPLDLPEYQPELSKKEEQSEMVPGAQDASMPILGAFKEFLSAPQEGYDKFLKLVEDYKENNRLPQKIETEEDSVKHREELEGMTSEELGEMQLASRKFVFEKLATIADRLDSLGATEEASLIDGFIKKNAEEDDSDYQGEDDKSEQSKRYDSKHHHSLQVREPKTKQERIDREGREKHHVHTMQSVEATALSTRYCPEHIGAAVSRVGESTYQCSIDGAIFNYETGWTDHDGNEHPGGSVAAQTPDSSGYDTPHRIFDSRENISNRVN